MTRRPDEFARLVRASEEELDRIDALINACSRHEAPRWWKALRRLAPRPTQPAAPDPAPQAEEASIIPAGVRPPGSRPVSRRLSGPVGQLSFFIGSLKLMLAFLTAGALLLLVFFEGAFGAFVAAKESPLVELAAANIECSDALFLRGADNAPLGVVRRHQKPGCFGKPLSAPFSDEVAVEVADAMAAMEGAYRTDDPTFFGLDVPGMAVAAAGEIETRVRERLRSQMPADTSQEPPKTFIPRRGSSPVLTAVEAVSGNPNPVRGLLKKIRFVRAAAIFEARYLRGDDTLRAHFLSAHLPPVRVRGGAPLGGAIAANVIFGGPPEDLSLAQRCVFSAAAGFPLNLPAGGASQSWERDSASSLERAKWRAKEKCVARLGTSATERANAAAEIDAFRYPQVPLPRLSARTRILVDDMLAAGQLSNAQGEVRLSLFPEVQNLAEQGVEAALIGLSSYLPQDACWRAGCQHEFGYAVILAEIVEEELLLRTAVLSHRGEMFGKFRNGASGPERLAQSMGLGSLAKIPLIALAHHEEYILLCNRHVGNIRNVSGPPPVRRCTPAGEGLVDLAYAAGRSMNLPFCALAEDHLRQVRRLHDQLDWRGGEDLGAGGACTGIGRAMMTPSQIMSLAHALDQGTRGRPLRSSGLTALQGVAGDSAVDLASLGYAPRVGAETAETLRSAIRWGTLSAMAKNLADPRWLLDWGKSGSPEADLPGEPAMARSTVLVVAADGRRFIAFAMISSRNHYLPVGFTTTDLARILRPVLDAMSAIPPNLPGNLAQLGEHIP